MHTKRCYRTNFAHRKSFNIIPAPVLTIRNNFLYIPENNLQEIVLNHCLKIIQIDLCCQKSC